MNRKRAFFVALAVLLIGLVIYIWAKSRRAVSTPIETKQSTSASQPSTTPAIQSIPDGRPAPLHPELAKPGVPEKNEQDTNQLQALLAVFHKPIVFNGKVIDEKGNPVSDANVKYDANNNPDPMGRGSEGTTMTDARGLFSIHSQGIGLFVRVSKVGYYDVPTSDDNHRIGSYARFSNAERIGKSDLAIPRSERPTIFVLRKKGEAASLIRVSERPVKVPKNGAPVEISLQTGQATAQGDLKVECWTEDQAKDAQGHYPWLCRISVPGGGLVKREGEFAFEAPAGGYEPSERNLEYDSSKQASVP